MAQTTRLFLPPELAAWLHMEVDQGDATTAERVVWGWLKPILKLSERPTPVPDEVFAWAIELGAIAYSNPEGLSEYQLESENSKYSSERRDEILRAASNGGTVPAGTVPAPTGSFPCARPYPDPAERCW